MGRWLRQPALRLTTREYEAVKTLRDHVIIVGYGLNGQNLARVLKAADIPYVILEQNGQTVRRARMDREPIYFGDGTRHDVLEHVGIEYARVLVFAIAASADTRRGVAIARLKDPELGLDLVVLGLVYDIEVEDADVKVLISLTSPLCPVAGQIVEDAKQAVLSVDGVETADVELTFEPPWTPERISPLIRSSLGL